MVGRLARVIRCRTALRARRPEKAPPRPAPRAGFGVPVNGLPGASVDASCNDTAALVGITTALYGGINATLNAMKLVGAQAVFELTFTVSSSDELLLPEPISASVPITIAECGPTEWFDRASETCLCITNSQRDADGRCTCNEGARRTAFSTNACCCAFVSRSIPLPHALFAGSHVTIVNGKVACELCSVDRGQYCNSGVLVPLPGYWHSFPNSRDVQPCPNFYACAAGGDNRTCAPAASRLAAARTPVSPVTS